MKKNKFKLMALATAMSSVLALTGCNNKDESPNPEVKSLITTDNEGNKTYNSHLIDLTYINPELIPDHLENLTLSAETIDYKVFGTDIFTGTTTAGFKAHTPYVWPENVFILPVNFWNYDYYIEKTHLKIEELDANIVVIHSELIVQADKEIRAYFVPEYIEITELNKGERIIVDTILYDGKIVALKQTGFGCDAQNVKDAAIGDYDKLISTFEEMGYISEDTEIEKNDLNKLVYKINN